MNNSIKDKNNFRLTCFNKFFVAGAFAGPASLISIYPFEFIKTQVQLQENKTFNSNYIINRTYNNYGIKGFYKGLNNLVYFNILRHSGTFYLFDKTKTYLNNYISNIYVLNSVSSIFSSLITSTLVGLPGENLKVYSITQSNTIINNKPSSFFTVNKQFMKDNGLLSYYKGGVNGIMKDTISQTFKIGFYFNLNSIYLKYIGKNENYKKTILESALLGGISGTLGTIFNNPIDVVQTRLQSDYNKKYTSVYNCYYMIYKEEGIKAFVKGLNYRIIRTLPGMAIYMTVFEQVKNLF
jgi:hypothetical protein